MAPEPRSRPRRPLTAAPDPARALLSALGQKSDDVSWAKASQRRLVVCKRPAESGTYPVSRARRVEGDRTGWKSAPRRFRADEPAPAAPDPVPVLTVSSP